MKNIYLLLLLFIAILGNAVAQSNVHYTRDASLQLHGEFGGKSLQGSAKQVGIILDYETTEMVLKLNLKDVTFDADSLNNIIQTADYELEIKGKLSLEYINTEEHLPQKFTFDGRIEFNDEEKKIEGEGELEHIQQSNDVACMFGMTINLKLDDYNLEVPGLENEMQVLITQVLLKQQK